MEPLFKQFISQILPEAEQKEIVSAVEKRLDYEFKDKALLLTALVHCSVVVGSQNESVEHNERLEFLGDSLLNFVTTEFLFNNFKNLPEGDLSKRKAIMVSSGALAECSRELGLGSYIQIGPSEEKGGGRDRSSILGDLFEAVLGALFLDGGIEPAKQLIEKTLLPKMDSLLSDETLINYKSDLLEVLQGKGMGQPEYVLVESKGPEHLKVFVIEAMINGKHLGQGEGSSKKIAQQKAAKDAIEKKLW